MDMQQLKTRAEIEREDCSFYIKNINDLRAKHPCGAEIRIPRHLADTVVQRCDAQDIPVYLLYGGRMSTAATYNLLVAFEAGR